MVLSAMLVPVALQDAGRALLRGDLEAVSGEIHVRSAAGAAGDAMTSCLPHLAVKTRAKGADFLGFGGGFFTL
jgi:hypothetical protein